MYIVKELQCSLINALSILQLFEGRPEEISDRASKGLRIMKRRQKEGQQESPLL